MKIRAALIAAALCALGALTGCRPFVPMTQELRDQTRLSDADLKNLQYYLSGTITLHRELESGGQRVTNHKLIISAGKTVEEVVVEPNTPGVCVAVGPSTLSISFEQGTSIDFTPSSAGSYASNGGAFATAPPNLDPFPGNRSSDAPSSNTLTGNYIVAMGARDSVKFMGKLFDAVGDTRSATLLIDAESLDQAVKQSKVLRGLKLPTR